MKPFIVRFVGDPNFSNALAVEILSYLQSSSPDKDLVDRIFALVLNAAGSQFELQKYSSASKGSNSHKDYPFSSWPNCANKEKGGRDAKMVVDLYYQLLQSDRKKASELLDQIQAQIKTVSDNELDRLVIPLLEQMMHSLDLSSVDASKFFKSAITTYIKRVVQNEPEKPSNWAQPNEEVHCYRKGCSFCESLKKFMSDPEEESRHFTLPDKDALSHARWVMPRYCRTEESTEQEFKVTKTLKAWENIHSEWQKRALKAQETLNQFPQAELKQCLVDEYHAIVDLHIVKAHDPVERPTAPRKRVRSDRGQKYYPQVALQKRMRTLSDRRGRTDGE